MPDPLVAQSRQGRTAFHQAHAELFARLSSQGQSPQALFIGCSDSRVLPEPITASAPGDLFVMRNVANIVPPLGAMGDAVGAVLEYAILHLQVRHLILCGHLDCGGIKALDEHVDQGLTPHIARWIEFARPAQTYVDAHGFPADQRHQAIVQQNVLNQLDNLETYDCVRDAVQKGDLTLHGWVYDIASGHLEYWDPELRRFVAEEA